jgi:hypothetical protein
MLILGSTPLVSNGRTDGNPHPVRKRNKDCPKEKKVTNGIFLHFGPKKI